MDKFATIKIAIRFKEVTFYTVQFEGETSDLFLSFINSHVKTFKDEISIIRSWIQKIGNQIGAQEQYFRDESFQGGDAKALPPPAKFLHLDCDLRLYCMRVNPNAVILFGGAQKTAQTAQDCKNVRPHFLLANQITKAIDHAFKNQDITIDLKTGRLIFDPDLTLKL